MHTYRLRLYSLGFTEKTLVDLRSLVNDNIFRSSAAWELSLWHANQGTPKDAWQCLELLKLLSNEDKSLEKMRSIAVLQTECLGTLGQIEKGRKTILKAIDQGPDANLFLAAANLENSISEKLNWINKAFIQSGIFPVDFDLDSGKPFFDRLVPGQQRNHSASSNITTPKVSIIIPAFNSEATISTAIESLLNQTWHNLEILVVDDHSSDHTTSIVRMFEKKDSRVKLLPASKNQGPYVARNIGLQKATGDYITCHDSDDWSHPQKIEIQASHLLNDPSMVANTSQLSRAGNNLTFFRRGNPGNYIQINMSSLMFRRSPVLEKAGYWDCVRFGGDGEYLRRIVKIFGTETVTHLTTGPLSFLRQSKKSLTGNKYFGYPGFFMGARREYRESHDHFHNINTSLHLGFPQEKRPFPVPRPLLPESRHTNTRRNFDIVMVSDFRLPGGTTGSNIEEILVQKKLGLRTGLIQMSRYDLDPYRTINPRIRELVDGEQVEFVVYGEKIFCNLIVLRHPLILQHLQEYIPDVQTKELRVIINQPPFKHYGSGGGFYYQLNTCQENLKHYFGASSTWHPIGPLVRNALQQHHARDLGVINLSNTDWHNIINVSTWTRHKRPDNRKIAIGRHSRDDVTKWPSDRSTLLQAYPDSEDFEIHVLGGAETPKKVLGVLPENWTVHEFGAMHPKTFLSRLDVFVYYTHPHWVESFGRVIFEAMATGVPVIIPPEYKTLFNQAAIYARPSQVRGKITELIKNPEYYEQQVKTALHYVETNFGYSQHEQRLKRLI